MYEIHITHHEIHLSTLGIRTEHMYSSAKASITKYHRLHDFHREVCFLIRNLGGCESKIKVLTRLISGKTSFPDLQTLLTLLTHG